VTGQSPADVSTTPKRKSFHADVNCQIIETANAGRAMGRATKANVRSMPAPSTCAASISSSEMPAK
jgi:hypothetical protein